MIVVNLMDPKRNAADREVIDNLEDDDVADPNGVVIVWIGVGEADEEADVDGQEGEDRQTDDPNHDDHDNDDCEPLLELVRPGRHLMGREEGTRGSVKARKPRRGRRQPQRW